MLHANISTAEKYDYLSAKFMAAYKWLANTDIEALADGAYRVLGDDVIANVQSYTTSPADSLRYETHDEHFDIQYIAEGREFLAVRPREGLSLLESKPERDAKFWADPDDECSMVLLHEGEFIIVAPEEAHKSRCCVGAPAHVRKVLMKVKI